MLGTVKFFDPNKKFGFITREDGQPDLFFHASGVIGEKKIPEGGDPVTFDLIETKKGLAAINVEVR